jgi:LCP family protein required for cell wall assembly
MDDFEKRIFSAAGQGEEPATVSVYKSRRRLRRLLRSVEPKKVDKGVGAPRRRRRWPWIVASTALIILLVVAGLGIWFFVDLKAKEPRMRVPSVDAVLSKHDGGPETTLIMGTDLGSVPGEEGPGRSDVMMLVTIAPDGNRAAIISIPRDSRTQIPGHRGYDKINAAHAYGGPKLAIQTVEKFTGLDVNHFVELNFDSFKKIVNAVGGVRMNIPHAIHDKYAGDVPAGDVVLNGDQALALVRARYDVKAVPNGDIDRTKNQRAFMEAMLSAVAHQRNPIKILTVADVVSRSAKTDLTFWKMFSLGRKLQSLRKSGKLETVIVPGQPKIIHNVWYYIVDTRQFEQMLSRYKSGVQGLTQVVSTDQSTTDPAEVRVKVLNGTGTRGLATRVSKELAGKGYERVTTGNSMTRYSTTTVYYAPGYDQAAKKAASDAGSSPVILQNEDVTTRYEADVVIVLGSDRV